MSYVRWADDSDIYIFADMRGGYTCCGCRMVVQEEMRGKNYNCPTLQEMILHLLEHEKNGHKVPNRVYERINHEMESL